MKLIKMLISMEPNQSKISKMVERWLILINVYVKLLINIRPQIMIWMKQCDILYV